MALEQLSTLDKIAIQKGLDSVERRLVKLEGAALPALPVEVVKPVATEHVLGIADRATGRKKFKRTAGKAMERALEDSLAWLARHQSGDGSWSASLMNCTGEVPCGGGPTTFDEYDVGVTGLALLAFLGEGAVPGVGDQGKVIARGVDWLKSQADPGTGLIGEQIRHTFLYDHAIGTIALCEAYSVAGGLELRATCQRAVDYILKARNSDSAWRYDVPPRGGSDTSVTGWMVTALKTAEEAGLTVDLQAYEGALAWIDKVTDPGDGRVGYTESGGGSSRVSGVNENFPTEKGEALTAVGLFCRMFMGQDDPKKYPILKKHGDLLLLTLPEWDPDGLGCDMYYWYYGSYAMHQLGGTHWKKWASALKKVIEAAPRESGCAKGSFDPIGPWGFAGGRIYSTALMALSIESHFRYARLGH